MTKIYITKFPEIVVARREQFGNHLIKLVINLRFQLVLHYPLFFQYLVRQQASSMFL